MQGGEGGGGGVSVAVKIGHHKTYDSFFRHRHCMPGSGRYIMCIVLFTNVSAD